MNLTERLDEIASLLWDQFEVRCNRRKRLVRVGLLLGCARLIVAAHIWFEFSYSRHHIRPADVGRSIVDVATVAPDVSL